MLRGEVSGLELRRPGLTGLDPWVEIFLGRSGPLYLCIPVRNYTPCLSGLGPHVTREGAWLSLASVISSWEAMLEAVACNWSIGGDRSLGRECEDVAMARTLALMGLRWEA